MREVLESKYQELSDILGTTWKYAYLSTMRMTTHLRVQPRRFRRCESSLAKGCCSRCIQCFVAEGTSSRKIQEMVADVKQVESQLRELTPSSGAYFNEVHHHFF